MTVAEDTIGKAVNQLSGPVSALVADEQKTLQVYTEIKESFEKKEFKRKAKKDKIEALKKTSHDVRNWIWSVESEIGKAISDLQRFTKEKIGLFIEQSKSAFESGLAQDLVSGETADPQGHVEGYSKSMYEFYAEQRIPAKNMPAVVVFCAKVSALQTRKTILGNLQMFIDTSLSQLDTNVHTQTAAENAMEKLNEIMQNKKIIGWKLDHLNDYLSKIKVSRKLVGALMNAILEARDEGDRYKDIKISADLRAAAADLADEIQEIYL
jgi:hypothetical protein